MNETEVQILENAPKHCEAVAELARWSQNYDWPTPYTLFCDLIGFNGEEFGECWFLPSVPGPYSPPANEDKFQVDNPNAFARVHGNLIDARLGYFELGLLADALKEYSERTGDVTDYVRSVLEAGQDDD